MKILLTGASGFVGSFLRDRPGYSSLESNGELVDLRDAEGLNSAIAGIKPDAVIHLAATSFVPASFARPQETYDINFLGTFNLLTALRESGFTGRFLFVGSADEYGKVSPDDLPIRESCPLKPRSPYGVSKVAAEALCYQWGQTEGFSTIMTRSFNHIGPGQSDQFAVSSFGKQIIEIKVGRREPVLRVGDLDATRDFTDVRDVARAYTALLERGRSGETYNVCSGVERSLGSILARLIELAGIDVNVERDLTRLRPAEQRRVCGNCEKLQRDTDWKPEISIDQSLQDILEDWKERLS